MKQINIIIASIVIMFTSQITFGQWVPVNTLSLDSYPAVSMASNNVVYVAGSQKTQNDKGVVYKSTDGGTTFSSTSMVPPTRKLYCITTKSENEILEDPSIQLVLSSGIPDERAPLGIRVMNHGKDYLTDKPGIITLEQLAAVKKAQQETKRIYSIMYSERFENKATERNEQFETTILPEKNNFDLDLWSL